MPLKKSTLSLALAAALSTGVTEAAQVTMDFAGLFTMLDPAGQVFQNKRYPYYGDPTWGYGLRTQISGSMSVDTTSHHMDVTIDKFNFNGGTALISNFETQSIGGGLIISNMIFGWGGAATATQMVLDSSGLFTALDAGVGVGDVIDTSTCAVSGACALPGSDSALFKGKYPIGPVPLATSSFNTIGQTGTTTTLGQLSLGTDDGIGGSPMDNGPFPSYSQNLDFTSFTVTELTVPSQVPIPAAIWLFGSGLLGLTAVARRRRT